MAIAVLSGFALALVAPWLHRVGRGATGWFIALLPVGLGLYFASFIDAIAAGETFAVTYPWAPSLGVSLSFYVDGLSLLFALLISGIGALIFIYSGAYLAQHPHQGRLYVYLLMFRRDWYCSDARSLYATPGRFKSGHLGGGLYAAWGGDRLWELGDDRTGYGHDRLLFSDRTGRVPSHRTSRLL